MHASQHSPSEQRQQRLRRHLLARIGRQYQAVSEVVAIGAMQLPFTRIKEPDRVLDQIVEEEDRRERTSGVRRPGDELHLPYWAELWDSSLGLGAFLLDQVAVQSKRVLDLGCGMGLAGLVAAALGARATLVDLESPALLFARLNTLDYADRVCVRRLDWRRDRLQERFDLILGADVLYERGQWDYLEPFWREHLARGGSILLGEPGRQTGDLFPDWIRSRGWWLRDFRQPVATRPQAIRIFVLRPGGVGTRGGLC